ncbi:MAG TPA: hypothetical protein PLA83_01730 [Deltaproteobacteria bacterium]|nr:hypothetical protein [Deltaproteobacteria bacterium]HQI00496.1 hypothetical protein [Deltaproteobacteria bacterium]HQJ08824.1 hypothetical protein [Deltaproteobacteria bacterium]
MKNILALLIILMLSTPLSAMKPVSDAELSAVLAQSGISIFIDMTMDVHIGTVAWGDPDGAVIPVNGTDVQMPGGWIGIDNLTIENLHVWPRTDFMMNGNAPSGGWKDIQPLTIDVLTMPSSALDHPFGTGADAPVGTTAVRIGIPTSTISLDKMEGNVVLGPYSTPTNP